MSFSYEDVYHFSPPIELESMGRYIEQTNRELSGALKLLMPKYRDPLLLSYFVGYSDAEIAKLLDVPVSTVGDRRRNAIRQLRERMEKPDE